MLEKNRNFWDNWKKEHPYERPSDEERQDSLNIKNYAYEKSRGKDYLRRAFNDEQNRILNNRPGSGYHKFPEDNKEEYPHDNPIDVDALFDELEAYANKTNLKITEGIVDGITIFGDENKISLKAAYADVAYIAGNYGVDNNAITYRYSGSRNEPEYQIHINVAMTKHSCELETHNREKRRNYPHPPKDY